MPRRLRIIVALLIMLYCLTLLQLFVLTPNKEVPITTTSDEEIENNAAATFVGINTATTQQKKTQRAVDDAKKKQQQRLSTLSCEPYGGPPKESAMEMVYWQDIPLDDGYVSPFFRNNDAENKKYLTFEFDEGGWNNIRMAMEVSVVMALAMGRTLVMPPRVRMSGLWVTKIPEKGIEQTEQFSLHQFFPFLSTKEQHAALDIIPFGEFLRREALAGKLRNKTSGEVLFPPHENRTDWNDIIDSFPNKSRRGKRRQVLYDWLRSIGVNVPWHYGKCIVGFPAGGPGEHATKRLEAMWNRSCCNTTVNQRLKFFRNNPARVNGTPDERLQEIMAGRKELCIYGPSLQNEKILHVTGDSNSGIRMLVHFYAFLFFENWKQDLWTKRFVRDNLRYVDELQCAAARIVAAVREKARENHRRNHNNNDDDNDAGVFDTMHIRRGDFKQQFAQTQIDALTMYRNVRSVLGGGNSSNSTNSTTTTLLIVTNERNKTYFDVFREHYDVYFTDDFHHLLKGVNTNYYGMIDQLVASRGRIFVGTPLSTFTGYINRLRGYHSQNQKLNGYERGVLESYYYQGDKDFHRQYRSIQAPFWAKEFPVAWRDIDRGISELYNQVGGGGGDSRREEVATETARRKERKDRLVEIRKEKEQIENRLIEITKEREEIEKELKEEKIIRKEENRRNDDEKAVDMASRILKHQGLFAKKKAE